MLSATQPQDLPLKLRMLVFAHIILLQILVNYDSGAIAASLENLSAPEFPGFNLSLTESVCTATGFLRGLKGPDRIYVAAGLEISLLTCCSTLFRYGLQGLLSSLVYMGLSVASLIAGVLLAGIHTFSRSKGTDGVLHESVIKLMQ